MASDLSSGCTETIGVLDEKEEGEISLEDVSSSEEGHLNYGYGARAAQCPNCLSTQHCAAWCTAPTKLYHSRSQNRREVDLIPQDAVQGKENRHNVKESASTGTKHTVSTLQEKNDDLVPISSDSDMEIVGLADNSKQIVLRSSSKTRAKKKRKKKRSHTSVLSMDDLVSSSTADIPVTECVTALKHDSIMAKSNSITRPHHREVSPVHRSSRSRLGPRSPPRRHRSPVRARSPFKRSRSPVIRARSPITRRSPRRFKSPKRSPSKTVSRRIPQNELSPTSHSYGNTHKLLKKVRQLESMGTHSLEETLNKNKEHASSLKEKLTNMMKGMSDNNGNVTNYSKEKSSLHIKEINDVDDEEDLALLRQKALETKHKKLNKRDDQPKTEVAQKVVQSANTDDDQDEEDLELRMIALRSAVLKKHQNRVQRGKSGKYKRSTATRTESPFSQSFLDSIPIPGEELLDFASPPHTPPVMSENNHTEDMELDTDVEREKEKLPYSPTDKITTNISMDTELLGIQPSDVSFISLNEANNSPSFSTASSKDEQKSLQGKIVENRSYLPNVIYYTPPQNTLYRGTSANIPYSPSDPTETPRPDFKKKPNSHTTAHYTETSSVPNSSQERPYSPTDTPMYDPNLLHTLPQIPAPITTSNTSSISLGSSFSSNVHENIEQYNHVSANPYTRITRQTSGICKEEHLDKVETFSMDPAVGSATTSPIGSISPTSSLITIDDLPETDVDASPITDPIKGEKGMEHIPDSLSSKIKDPASEPLYMKGVPDITKDVNKIPTLINRTLVPVTILKSNKQLQQPLPARKQEVYPEPTFKSADMQPVVVNEEANPRTSTLFKPMKLVPFAQKSHSVLVTPTAFHDSLQEELSNEISRNKNTSLLENKDSTCVQNIVSMDTKSSDKTCDITAQKRKKLTKKGSKRKSVSTMQSISKKNSLCINKDNIGTVDRQMSAIAESIQSGDHKQNNEASKERKENEQKTKRRNMTNDVTFNSPNRILENNTDHKSKISSKTSAEGKKIENTLSSEMPEQVKTSENRRQSLDEDEEALRAILLASLPKRAKVTDVNTSNSTSLTTTSTILNCNKQAPANPTAPKGASPVVNTVNAPSGTTMPLSLDQHSNLNVSKGDRNTVTSKTKVTDTTIKTDLSNGISDATIPLTSGRKRPIPMTKGPQKKHMKKISIPASTKVVNNAKKYQNAIVQKRLNLQKAAMLYSNQKPSESKTISKTLSSETKWSTNSKTSMVSDTQRIVINLESDTESDSESEQHKIKGVLSSNSAGIEKNQPAINSKAEFEKNLDHFLRDLRKKQESVAAARPTTVAQTLKKDTIPATQVEKTNSTNLHTPLAVRHLPASQQEEYRRLKQQIIEREKLRLRRTIESNSSLKNKVVGTPSKTIPSNSPNKEVQSAKTNQTTSTKSQNTISQQLNKENNSKNFDTLRTMPESMTNLSIRVCNENTVTSSNVGTRIVENPLPSVSTARTVFENVTPTQADIMKPKPSSGLKILSKDEVNRKYVQIQVKQDTNERVVTINDKVTPNERTGVSRNETPGNRSANDEDTRDQDISQFVENMDKQIITNDARNGDEVVDSDASTIILSRENQNRKDKDESLDTTESTILLSRCQEESRTSTLSSAESNDASHSSLPKKSSDNKGSIEENWEAIKKDAKTELGGLITLPRAEQERHLLDTEQKLVKKRYTILDELAEMSVSLRQWHMERDLQTNLVAEVKKLREQLRIAEERLQVQRNHINSIGPKVLAAHGRINAGRQECFKLSKICSVLGTKVIGKEYKVPEAGAQLLDNRLKEVANHTRQLSRKKVPSIDIPEVYTSTPQKPLLAMSAEMSTEEYLLSEKSNIDNSDTTVLTENDHSTGSNEPEETLQPESIVVDLNEATNQEENTSVNDNEQSISEEGNNILNMQSELSSTPIISKDSHDRECEESSESVEPSISESLDETRSPAKPETVQQPKKTLLPYVSILTHFKVPRNTNPNGVLCPYELMGTCSDGDCQFVHQSESQAK